MKVKRINSKTPFEMPQGVDHLVRGKAFRALLEEGYRELGAEAKRLERDFKLLDRESLKYID